ncbi:endonuclease [Arenitalea sp.]|nr:endonuclease [Algibacter sp.]MDA9070183.1 endonuclease [Algibacter sp.]
MKHIYLVFLLVTSIAFAQLTPPASLQTYYTDIDFTKTGSALYDDLAITTSSKHGPFLTYSERHQFLYKADEDPSNGSNVLLMYSGESRSKTEYLSGSNPNSPQTFNTEHVYPRSLLDIGISEADLHLLRSCDININSSRGNNPFTDGSGTPNQAYFSTGSSFFPGWEWRGDVARIIMYVNLRYNEPFSSVGTLNLFLEWNSADPVSLNEIEDNRNTVISDAQGNRNPFIDNPYLATVIWGGTPAQDRWNTTPDTEDPTTPAALTAANPTETTVDLSWTASTDNTAVSSYDVYIGGAFYVNTSSHATTYTVTGLTASTAYTFTLLARDASGNQSSLSTSATETTTAPDTEDPTIPASLTASNPTASTVDLSWTASTDNTAVTSYDVYVGGVFYVNTGSNTTTYTVTNLTSETAYTFTILAKDAAGNTSTLSGSAIETTLVSSSSSKNLFFSEYMEGSSNNKAFEIANFTGSDITDLSIYQVKLSANGAADWTTNTYNFPTGASITDNDVYVIGNGSLAVCTGVVDNSNSSITGFNGNDAIGLFKNGVLIDIIGTLGDTATFGSNTTLVRNSTVAEGNTTFNINEWTASMSNTCSNLGQHSQTTLNLPKINNNDFLAIKLYPNPLNGDQLFIKTNEILNVKIFSILGEKITDSSVDASKNYINVSNLNKGVYLVSISNGNKSVTKKLIKL